MRNPQWYDNFFNRMEEGLRYFTHPGTGRALPVREIGDPSLTPQEEKESAALMRINHCGEVCAQALYLGQALVAREPQLRTHLLTAAAEEQDHLSWCRERIHALHSHTSYLNPCWFILSFGIGILAGLSGDCYSLGFIAETEEQVEQHLKGHLEQLPLSDLKSKNVLMQMIEDECTHKENALSQGGVPLPSFIQELMRMTAKVMTTTAYYI